MASNVTRDHHTWTRNTIKNVSGNTKFDLTGHLTIDVAGGDVTIQDVLVGKPDLTLLSEHGSDSPGGPSLIFKVTRTSSYDASDDDKLGSIFFEGENDGGTSGSFAGILGLIETAAENAEKGRLELQVLTESAGGNDNVTGLKLTGSSTNDEVDVTVGAGSASLTTIAGNVDIDGDTITSAGTLEIDPGGALSITGVPVSVDSGQKLLLDGGDDTYIAESSGNVISLVCGGAARLVIGAVAALLSDTVALKPGEKLHFDGSGLGIDTYIQEVSADKLEFMVGGDEMLTLDEANQRVTIEADKLTYAIAGGTEWSATDSAYAGHILGYTCIGADVNYDSYTLTTSFICFQDSGGGEIRSRFKTPPSEFVEIEVELYFSSGSGASDLFLSLSNESIYGNNTLHHDGQFEKLVCSPARGNGGTVVQKFLLNADHLEAIGSANNIYIAAKTDSTSGTPLIRWGGDGTGELTNLVMKATALPANIIVGS